MDVNNKLGIHRNAKKRIIILFLFSLILQVILVFFSDGTQNGDMAGYEYMANIIAKSGQLYPNNNFLYTDYIHSPGYVNFLGFTIWLFGTIKGALYLNVLLNAILAFEIFYLARHFFNETTAYLSLFLFVIYPTTYGIVYFAGSDLPSTILFLGAIILYSQRKLKYAILAGVLVALGNWIRPFIPALLIVILYMTYAFHKGMRIKLFSGFAATLILTVCLIGFSVSRNFKYFSFQASTAGVNMIMGANDDADGSYDNTVLGEGKIGYINPNDSLDVIERDQYWRSKSIEWIQQNPVKWVKLIPFRLAFMYAHDPHAMYPLSGDMTLEVEGREYNIEMVKNFPHWNSFQWVMFYNQIFYMTCLFLACVGAYYIIKSRNKMGLTLLLYWFLGTCMILFIVGCNRYHYPYMPVIILFASYAIGRIIKHRTLKFVKD